MSEKKTVEIEFKGKNANLKKSVKELEGKMDSLENKTKGLEKTTNNSFSNMAVSVKGMLTAATALAIVAGFSSITASMRELEAEARLVGISASELSKYQLGLEKMGIESDKTMDAIKELNKRIAEASNAGTGDLFDAIKKGGLDIAELSKKTASEQFLIYADLIKRIGTTTGEAKRLADIAAGDSGVAALTAINMGGRELVEATKGYSQESIDQWTKFGNSVSGMWVGIKEIAVNNLSGVADFLSFTLESISTSFNNTQNMIAAVFLNMENYGNLWGESFLMVIDGIKLAFNTMGIVIVEVFNKAISGIGNMLGGLVGYLNEIISAINLLGSDIKPIPNIFENLNVDGVLVSMRAVNEEYAKSVGISLEKIGVIEKEIQATKDFFNVAESSAVEIAVVKKKLSEEELARIAKEKLDREAAQAALLESQKKMAAEMDGIAAGAARSMQSNFENFFYSAMRGENTNLIQDFEKTIQKMLAQAAAADLANALGFGSGSTDAGIFGSMLGSSGGESGGGIGGLFAGLFGGGAATGAEVVGGGQYLVGENGPELFTPKQKGSISPNVGGATTVYMTVNATDSNSFQKNQRQIVADLTSQINKSNRRDQ